MAGPLKQYDRLVETVQVGKGGRHLHKDRKIAVLVGLRWVDGWPDTPDATANGFRGVQVVELSCVESSRVESGELGESSKIDGGSEAMTAKQETKGRSWGLVCCVVNAIMPSLLRIFGWVGEYD